MKKQESPGFSRGEHVNADYCTPIPGGVICGTRMREHSRRSEGIKWCFRCRTRCEMWRVVAVSDGESYYGPTVHIECGGCRAVDSDLFPGRIREWDEQ